MLRFTTLWPSIQNLLSDARVFQKRRGASPDRKCSEGRVELVRLVW